MQANGRRDLIRRVKLKYALNLCNTFCTVYLQNYLPTYSLLTYLLTPCSTVLLQKLTGSQPVKKFPAFMEPEGSLPHSQVPTTSHFLKIQLNIILPSTPGSPHWSLSLRFPHQDRIRPPLLPHTRYMPRPSHSSRFYHPNNIGWAVQIIQLLIM